MKLALIAALALALVPALAHAEAVPYGYHEQAYSPPKPKDPWQKLRFEGAIGGLVGSQRVGYIGGSGGGLHVDLGARLDRFYLYAEYDFLGVGESSYEVEDPVRGFMHRFGGNLRYSLAAFGGKTVPVRGDVWAELGVGHETVLWHEGGKLGRRDLALGLGAQATFKLGRTEPKFIGVYYAFKMWVAGAPERKDDEPMCAGPCDEATGPSPYDIGVFFNFGVPFGR